MKWKLAQLLVAAVVLFSGSTWFLDVKFADLWQPSSGPGSGRQPPSSRPAAHQRGAVAIASFNIQVFGQAKLRKPEVMRVLAEVMRKFDVVAIQEIRSREQNVLPELIKLVNAQGAAYDYAISRRLGRTTSQEQYAYVFDTTTIEIDRESSYVVGDPKDLLHREPFVGAFRVRGPPPEQAFTFSLINIHTDPDEVDLEVNVLDDVLEAVRNDGRGEDDIILLGDLNANDRTFGELGEMPGILWVIQNQPTNTRLTKQYDNILFHQQATIEYTGTAGVLQLQQEFGLTREQALEVSDHLPVWAMFSIYEGGEQQTAPGPLAARANQQPQWSR